MSHVDKQKQLLKHFVDDLNVDQSDIDFYLDRMGYEHLIRIPPDGI